ncbi:hypothetical protein ACIODS_11915 [Micromonospora chalcea]|uniref:hypothetical protein n=1 Tax=Micromonospora chalcea TaxID=1874 RepID=UPI00380132C0
MADSKKAELFKKLDADTSKSYAQIEQTKQWISGLRDGSPAVEAELRQYRNRGK